MKYFEGDRSDSNGTIDWAYLGSYVICGTDGV